MNENDILPLYSRITEFSVWPCVNDGERLAVCPDCRELVCVFCDDMCETCQTPMW